MLNGTLHSEITELFQRIKRTHLQEFSWLFVSSILTILIGFLLIKVISRIGPEEYGKYALVLSIVPLVNAVIYVPIDQYCQRYYYSFYHENTSSIFVEKIISIIKKVSISIMSLSIFGVLISKYFLKLDISEVYFGIVSCFYIIIATSSIPFQSLLNTMRKRKAAALFSIGEKALQLLGLFLIASVLHLDAFLVLAACAVGSACFLVGRVVCINRQKHPEDQEGQENPRTLPRIYRQLFSFGLPILFFGILTWLQTNGERWVLQFSLGLEDVGRYTMMAMICQTLLLIIQAPYSSFMGPITWEKFANLNDAAKVSEGLKLIRLSVIFLLLEMIIISSMLYFFSDLIVIVLSGKLFATHSRLMPLIFIGIALFFLGQTLNSVGFGLNKMAKYTFPKVSGAIIALACYAVGAHLGGIPGIAWASVIANSMYVGLTLIANRNILCAFFQDKSPVQCT